MLPGQRDLSTVGRLLLTELTPLVNAQLGVIYRVDNSDSPCLRLVAPTPMMPQMDTRGHCRSVKD